MANKNNTTCIAACRAAIAAKRQQDKEMEKLIVIRPGYFEITLRVLTSPAAFMILIQIKIINKNNMLMFLTKSKKCRCMAFSLKL